MGHDWQPVTHMNLWMGSLTGTSTIGSKHCALCGAYMIYAFGCVNYEPGGLNTPPPCVPRCSTAQETPAMEQDNPLQPPLTDEDIVVLRRMGARPDNKGARLDDIRMTAPIAPAAIADWFGIYEMHGTIERIELSPADFPDIRKFCRDVTDLESNSDMYRAGHRGVIWHAAMWSFKDVPEGKVYIVARAASDKPLVYGRVVVNRVR